MNNHIKKYIIYPFLISLIFIFGISAEKNGFFTGKNKFLKKIVYKLKGKTKDLKRFDYPHIYPSKSYLKSKDYLNINLINLDETTDLKIHLFSAIDGKLLETHKINKKLKKANLFEKHEYSTCFDIEGRECKNFFKAEIKISSKGPLIISLDKDYKHNSNLQTPRSFFLVNNYEDLKNNCSIGVVYPDFTWSAYNTYGGRSLYTRNYVIPGRVSSNIVTVNRPFNLYEPHNIYSSGIFQKTLRDENICSIPLTNSLMHNENSWQDLKLIILTSHDEYWTKKLRYKIHDYITKGGKLGIFSGNTSYRLFHINKDQHSRSVTWATIDPPERTIGLATRFGILPIAEKNGICNIGACPYCAKRCLKKEFKYYQKENNMSKLQYENLLGMQILTKNKFFNDTKLKKGDFFGHKSSLIFHESDGAPLNRKNSKIDSNKKNAEIKGYSINGFNGFNQSEIGYLKPKNIKAIAAAWLTNWDSSQIQYVATMVDFNLGKGRVVNSGTVGWYKSIQNGDLLTKKIFLNIVKDLNKD